MHDRQHRHQQIARARFLALAALLLVWAGVGRAADVPLAGSLLVVRAGRLARLVLRPAAPMTLPDPSVFAVGSAALHVFDLGGAPGGGDDTYPLPGRWTVLGKAERPSGFRYQGAGSAEDPCALIIVKRNTVKALCRGSAIGLAPPFRGDVAVELSVGAAARFCAVFGGRLIQNRAGILKRSAAPALGCATDGSVTTTSTTSTTTAGGSTTSTTRATLPPGPHLVINEVDYDQPGNDTHEFVEIYNPRPNPTFLAGLALVFVDGATGTEYLRVDLTPAVAIPAGECLVVGATAVTATIPQSAVPLPSAAFDAGNAIQNGAPDGILLLDTATNLVLDAFSYEGEVTAAIVNGLSEPVSLVEGTPLAVQVADRDTIAGSLIRRPSGTDTDNASNDWTFTSVLTPGQPNLAF